MYYFITIWISYPDIFQLKPNKYLKANSDMLFFDPQYEIYKFMFKSTFNFQDWNFCTMLKRNAFYRIELLKQCWQSFSTVNKNVNLKFNLEFKQRCWNPQRGPKCMSEWNFTSIKVLEIIGKLKVELLITKSSSSREENFLSW